MQLFNGHLFDPCRDGPQVTEGVNDRRHPITMNGARRLLDRSGTGFDGAPVHVIYVADVYVYCAEGWLTLQWPHGGRMTDMTELPIRMVR